MKFDPALKSKLSKNFAIAAGICLMAMPTSAEHKLPPPPPEDTEQKVVLQNIIRDDTIVLYGKLLEVKEDGQILLEMDGRHIGFLDSLAIANGSYPYAAIIPPESDIEEDRLCPYFGLASRTYSIKQIEANVQRFEVTTTATDDEIKMAQQYQCIVTEKPDLGKIEYKSPDPHDGFTAF